MLFFTSRILLFYAWLSRLDLSHFSAYPLLLFILLSNVFFGTFLYQLQTQKGSLLLIAPCAAHENHTPLPW